jgi:hypothetical protein
MIIGINGYAGSGKDTVGTIIQYITSKYKPCALEACLKHNQDFSRYTDWEIKKWAGKLKTIASILTGIPEQKFEDQDFKKTELPSQWDRQFYTEGSGWLHRPMLVREFLQMLGTDGLRTGLHENTWVNALMSDYRSIDYNDDEQPQLPNWIITDTRFPNEAQAIKDAGGIVIRIDRPGINAVNAHPSETSLDDWSFDYKIANASDIVALAYSIQTILLKEKII